MLSRRGFLTGTLMAAATAGTALLKATPEEVEAFGKPLLGPVTVMQPEPFRPSDTFQPVGDPGEFVYNHKGEIIGVISDMTVERNHWDVTAFDKTYRLYQSGLLQVRYTVVGTGFAQVKVGR